MEFKTFNILHMILLLLSLFAISQAIPTLSSFKQLGEHHCQEFPVEVLWRLATGHISEKYGEQYFDYDCYIRQFVKKDGMTVFQDLPSDEDQQEQQQEQQQQVQQNIPEVDPLVQQYAQGVKKCLPDGIDSVEAVYSMWRFMRYVVQHDYAYEWMRAKIRSGMGYQAQKPSAWMDGQTKAERLRLDKLFSNQFYQYVDKLMFKDFLYPIMTFLKRNTVFALSGDITESGKPILVQSLEVHNYYPNIFKPVILEHPSGNIFSYTIPGIPLLFAGSNSKIAWAFTGVLLDRSNVQQIQTVNNKFYNHDTQEWISLTKQNITIPGVPDKICQFTYSASGTLYTKQNKTGKVSEYISKWHENEKKVRVIFSGIYDLIINDGVLAEGDYLQFPFNSIVIVNEGGIFQYLCPQFYPSYFLYPDMFGQPEKISQRWVSYKKKYVAISNSLLTTNKQDSYRKGELLSPIQQQIAINIRKFNTKINKFNVQSAINFITDISTTPYIKKQREYMTSIYRKVKFIYFPEQNIRKQCDRIISAFEKWDNSLQHQSLAPIYILWEYFYRDFTFNYVSASKYGLHLARHKATSELYWANQMGLWSKGTSYGECDSHQYQEKQHQYNGTGQNSTCYFNIMRGLNRTRQIINQRYDGNLAKINLNDFKQKKVLDLLKGEYMGTSVEQAFSNYYSHQLLFGAQIKSQTILYNPSGYLEQKLVSVSFRQIQNPTDGDL